MFAYTLKRLGLAILVALFVSAVAFALLRLSGDPAHPFTRGTLCAKVNHYLDRVYHPDRVLHPLKRVGPKGEGRFVRVSWDDALGDIAARWRAIVAESACSPTISATGSPGATFSRRKETTSTPANVGSTSSRRRASIRVTAGDALQSSAGR